MGKLRWYKRDPDAFLNGVAVLTLEETGAYAIVIEAYYAVDGELPDDDYRMSRVLRCNPRTWRKLKLALIAKGKLHLKDGFLVVNRGEATLKEAREFSAKQARKGRMSAELRSNEGRMRGERAEKPNENSEAPQPSTTTTTTTKEDKKDLTSLESLHSSDSVEEGDRGVQGRKGEETLSPSLPGFAEALPGLAEASPKTNGKYPPKATGPPATRGTRLPKDWEPLEADVGFALSEGLTEDEARREFDRFCDYWHARAGAGATKVDWDLTFKNWIRKSADAKKEKLARLKSQNWNRGKQH
jgi:uncharacterized protein YdaU (DUF1376 family)